LSDQAGEAPLLIESGRRTGLPPERFPMMAHGVLIGELRVETRRPGARFSAAETRLLQGLALQAGVAAESCRSTLELQRARERLVLAREEERRRLRRDLHDGVASALVGARMLATAAQASAPADSRAPALLATLAQELTVCTEEVRDLIDGLRPAVLDAGLSDALHQAVRRVSETLPVALDVAGDLDDLPAAVEVVALRMVTEALTNVVKHASATRAGVRVVADEDALTIEVIDNGVGLHAGISTNPQIDESSRSGVGLTSIRSRVEEVGGWFTTDDAGPGLCCRAVLPLGSHLPYELDATPQRSPAWATKTSR
jgi:two-component system, NarL family, sensor kinase